MNKFKIFVNLFFIICFVFIISACNQTKNLEDNENNEDNNIVMPEETPKPENSIIYYEKALLTTIEPTYYQVGYGENYYVNEDANGNLLSLKVDGIETEFKSGFFAHAYSVLRFDINKYIKSFKTFFGIGLSARGYSQASMKFTVIIDDEIVYESNLIDKSNPSGYIDLNIKEKVNYIMLVIDDLGSNGYDHGLWGDPMIEIGREVSNE